MNKLYSTIKITLVLSVLIFLTGCESYLAKSDLASIPESEVFGTFKSYQGFVSNMYNYIFDNTNLTVNADTQWSAFEECVTDASYQTETLMEAGSYKIDNLNLDHNPLRTTQTGITSTNSYHRRSMWDMPWFCIRLANIALEKLPLFKEGTQSERDVIKGQAYFFRAFSHFELIKVWGGLPYVDKVFQPNDDTKLTRLSYNECTEKIVTDLDSAIKYLPVDWDTHPAGVNSIGYNSRLITLGAAMAIKAKVLLYAASPLMNGSQTDDYSYKIEYCKRAAQAAYQVLDLADQGVYQLLPWSNYSDNFYKMDNTFPGQMNSGAPELIFEEPQAFENINRNSCNLFSLISIGYVAQYESPTQNVVDKFEMKNGNTIPSYISSDKNYDLTFDPTVTDGRDPRMKYNILTDRELVIQNSVHIGRTDSKAELYIVPLGADRNGNGQVAGYSETGYGIKKFTPIRYNRFDDVNSSSIMSKYHFIQPHLRLAEIFLIFAEAANEAYGPKTLVPQTTFSAELAVNTIRARAGMPPVLSQFTSSKELFRERIRNERSVELCFEGHRWFDVRRWHIAHLDAYKSQYGLSFDKEHTFFTPYNVKPIIFNLRDYWLPLPTDQVNIYKAMFQNPGW